MVLATFSLKQKLAELNQPSERRDSISHENAFREIISKIEQNISPEISPERKFAKFNRKKWRESKENDVFIVKVIHK